MAKRQINKQQLTRIHKMQRAYQESENLNAVKDGLVITRFGSHAEIEDEHKARFHCSIRPNIDSLVAGDKVKWQPEGDNQGVVLSYYPRKTVLSRPRKNEGEKPIAANITQLIIVVAPKPEISWFLLDSYLVIAESLGLKVLIVLNKIDLPCKELQQELRANYQSHLEYPLVFVSLANYEDLKQRLSDEISVFVGQSGVGKSSIISGILPHELIQTQEISRLSELGRHTTTNSFFYHLPKGGALIDSPGIREFALWNMSVDQLLFGFKELKDFRGKCKFRNCSHQQTAGCALVAALDQKSILTKRYESLEKIIKTYGL